MKKIDISASQLIQTLKKSKHNSDSKLFLENLIEMRSDYEQSKDKVCLKVKINTDDDFSVNGETEFEGFIVVEDEKRIFETLENYINSLQFIPSDSIKVKYFKGMLPYHKEEFMLSWELSCGGNHTLDVYVVPFSPHVEFGNMIINLAE